MVGMDAERKIMVLATKDAALDQAFSGLFSSEYDIMVVGDKAAAKDLVANRRGEIGVVILDSSLDIAVADLYVDETMKAPGPDEGVDAYLDYLDVSYSQSAIRSRHLGEYARGPLPILVTIPNHDSAVVDYWLDQGVMEFIELPLNERLTKIHVNECARVYRSLQKMGDYDYDEMTGLLGRTAFWAAAREMIDAEPECAYNVIVSDIESFKRINERFGVEKGNELLRYVGQCLKAMNSDDILFARYSGDQFVGIARLRADVMDEGPTMLTSGMDVMYHHAPVRDFVVKFGLYVDVDKSLPLSAMCDRALMAVRSVKHQYGKVFAVYEPSMSEKRQRELRIVENMERALEEGQFQVRYQPKHDAATGALVGAEALVRWAHPEFGPMEPDEFIQLFEQNGFITRLDYFVWNQACRDLRLWQDSGLDVVPVSVNVSRRDFFYDDYLAYVKRPFGEYGLAPDLLHIEITETAYLENTEEIIPLVSALRDWGVKVELDDFGSGYSSLGILTKIPVDVIKLDSSFVRDLENQKKVVEAVIELAHNLDCAVVAEGVEEHDQVETLRALGCEYVQGFWFSRPMARDEFGAYLEKHAR